MYQQPMPAPPADSRTQRTVAWIVATTVIAVAVIAAAVVFLVTSPDGRNTPPASPPVGVAPAPAAAPAPAEPTNSNADRTVCGDLDRLSEQFYVDMYEPLMTTGNFPTEQLNMEQIGTTAAVVGALSTIGAPDGHIEGSEAISHASQPVREALARLTSEADRGAQRLVDNGISLGISGSSLAGIDLTPLVTAYTDSLIACTDAGHQPNYFDPEHLIGQ